MRAEVILVEGAAVHNLQHVSCRIPHQTLCCLTGVSGSGKSSFAFDTLFIEGQRRYIQSLSHQAKRIVGGLPRPDVASIVGLTPTIAVEQKTSVGGQRSTVGTVTEIYDFLRLLYAKAATPYCPISDEPVVSQTREQIVATILENYTGKKIGLLAPVTHDKKGTLKEELEELERKGYTTVRLDGTLVRIDQLANIDPSTSHSLDAVIDRIGIHPSQRDRVASSVNTALDLGKGLIVVYDPENEEEELFSEFAYSKRSGKSYPPLQPHDFSFNHPSGMCPECEGRGETREFVLDRIIDENKTLREGFCVVAGSYDTVWYRNVYDNLAFLYGFSVDTPWKKLSPKAKNVLLYGTEKKWTRMTFINPNSGATWENGVQWRGILHEAKSKYLEAKSERYKRQMEEYLHIGTCRACNASRLQPYPSAARLKGLRIQEVVSKSIDELVSFFELFTLSEDTLFAQEIVDQVRSRIHFLQQVGLGYLSLDRAVNTLSGGEFQRVRLASQIGSSLVGITYILDEPSIGLHATDNEKLIHSLCHLRDRGNTVIVVEHDEHMIRSADWILDFGPGAGAMGGSLLYEGPISDLNAHTESLTSDYLFGRKQISREHPERTISKKRLMLKGACLHNLKKETLSIPIGSFVAITGVSGSGKSSLILDTLYPALANRLMKTDLPCGPFTDVSGVEHIDKVIHIDQSPIGRTPRSNPATYSGVFDDIRTLFATLAESKSRGWTPGRFSFNVKEGSCPVCSGMGFKKVDMDFLEEAWVECTACQGKRFESETLSVRYKEKTIADVLNMSCGEALELFAAVPPIKRGLEILCQVGLDYIHLGQPSTTLSGGEAQRLKIARELARPKAPHTLYLLDEPTTGLHFHDLKRLLHVLHELVDRGHTVVVIEHNMELIKTADWIIDMGPGAGIEGGSIVAQGRPEKVATLNTPTGKAMRATMAPVAKKSTHSSVQHEISISGARQNNLRNLSLTLPHHQLIALIGPSGVGKSSLALETLYAEGQRQYVESLSTYARQFIKQMPRPFVDTIQGLPPTVALEQRHHASNPRSTVGTITEIYDYLRILWAQLGTAYCPKTGSIIQEITKDRVVETILSLPPARTIILAPCQIPPGTPLERMADRLRQNGYSRVRLNGGLVSLDEPIPPQPPGKKPTLEIVVDRLTPSAEERPRLLNSVGEAARLGSNTILILRGDEEKLFNLTFSVAETGESYPPITAQTFAFNTSQGMCPECRGLGVKHDFEEEDFNSEWLETEDTEVCEACGGTRLNPLARNVKLDGLSITEFCDKQLSDACAWFQAIRPTLPLPKSLLHVADEIESRLQLAMKLQIGYIALSRAASTLSSGEAQRVQLVSQLGSGLSGLLYVIDEPSVGLHPQDIDNLLKVFNEVKSFGNTLLVMEHDPHVFLKADTIVELGTGGGSQGGELVFMGTPKQFLQTPTLTSHAVREQRFLSSTPVSKSDAIEIREVSQHNLTNFSCTIPTGALVGIVGVTGSGKSTLLSLIEEALHKRVVSHTKSKHILGLDAFSRLVTIDQKPFSHTVRSDISTYLDFAPLLRDRYVCLPEAKRLGLQSSQFSPYTYHGMCRECSGLGYKRIDMYFLAPVKVACEECQGLRFNRTVLSVEFQGVSLGKMLQLPITKVAELFLHDEEIHRFLKRLLDFDLGYLALGQEMASLSHGEAQRVKMAREFAKGRRKPSLYLMDEPSIGLHMTEVKRLIQQLQELKERSSVIVVEHNLNVIAACDYLIELGPGAGPNGGTIIAEGTPKQLANNPQSITGRYLFWNGVERVTLL